MDGAYCEKNWQLWNKTYLCWSFTEHNVLVLTVDSSMTTHANLCCFLCTVDIALKCFVACWFCNVAHVHIFIFAHLIFVVPVH